jgi:hypothetical protein
MNEIGKKIEQFTPFVESKEENLVPPNSVDEIDSPEVSLEERVVPVTPVEKENKEVVSEGEERVALGYGFPADQNSPIEHPSSIVVEKAKGLAPQD